MSSVTDLDETHYTVFQLYECYYLLFNSVQYPYSS